MPPLPGFLFLISSNFKVMLTFYKHESIKLLSLSILYEKKKFHCKTFLPRISSLRFYIFNSISLSSFFYRYHFKVPFKNAEKKNAQSVGIEEAKSS